MDNPTDAPEISVVIPVKNGYSTLGACLDGILAQSLREQLEVIVIDSGSTDGTLELLTHYPVKVLHIAPEDFNHGETRNLGTRLAHGEFVVMTVQDATPVDQHWLERMLAHFDDPKVAGVCGQQVVPHELDKNPLAWLRPYSEPVSRKVCVATSTEFKAMSSAAQVSLCGWDDVTAMYRRSKLLETPFRRVGFAEDMLWARDALLRGYALVYDYSARVYHYHHENFRFRFRRHFTILYHLHRHFGHTPAPMWVLPELTRCAYRVARRKYCPTQRAEWLAYNIRLALAEWLASWLFWLQAKLCADGTLERTNARLCATPPQPIRSQSAK